MRKVLKWLIVLFIASMLLVIAAYFLAIKYEGPVRNYIVQEVNKRLESDLHVSSINFSLLKKFPSASLVMENVWADENVIKIGEPDTLFFFGEVYLNFNVMDILNGVYRINEIETQDGFIRLTVDEKGRDNFHIWKENKDTTGFLLELNRVHIENTEFRYTNLLRQQDYQLYADNLYFTGRFSEDSYTMGVEGTGLVDDVFIKGTSYMRDREVAIESDLDIISSEDKYVFRKGVLLIDDALDFSVTGNFEGEGIDLKVSGENLDIIKTLGLLPNQSRSMFDAYESSGVLEFEASLKGIFGKTENPRISATFSFENARVSRKGSNWEITTLSGNGSIDNGEQKGSKSTVLVLENLSGKLNDDPFEASFNLRNFKRPTIVGDANFNTDLEGLREFFNLDALDEGEGQIALDAHIETTINDPDSIQPRDFLNAKASGNIQVSGARIKLKNDERVYTIDQSDFEIVNNALEINQYQGKINDCDIELSGKVNNFLDYLFADQGVLNVKGKIVAGDIDLGELFPTREVEATGETSVVVAFPTRAKWDLQIVAKSFKKGKFVANDISGRLLMDAFKAEASSLHFVSQEGNMQGKIGLYRFAENQFGFKTDFELKEVNIKTLFQTFDNFEQDYVTSDVLQGTANVGIEMQAFCDSTFNIQTKTMMASIDLNIVDGGLVGFQPLLDVADYVKEKRMLRLFISADELKKRLSNVQFAKLSNEISIRNGVISIPQMAIKSSAIDLNVNGTHTFDNEIDYAMDFALSDLLQLKDRKEPYNEYVKRDNEGKTRIYLTMKGTTDDFEMDLVKTDLKFSLKEKVVQEKNEVKGILKQDFGLFKKDSNAVVPKKEEPKQIGIEFDAEEGTELQSQERPTSTPTKKEEPKKENSFLNRIIKKTETDKKKLKDGEFEDDDF
jgi:hypothetical protein